MYYVLHVLLENIFFLIACALTVQQCRVPCIARLLEKHFLPDSLFFDSTTLLVPRVTCADVRHSRAVVRSIKMRTPQIGTTAWYIYIYIIPAIVVVRLHWRGEVHPTVLVGWSAVKLESKTC
jgi:hypothetical protein